MIRAVFVALVVGAPLLILAALLSPDAVCVPAAASETAMSNVQSWLNQATDILRTPAIPVEERRARLRALAEQHLDLAAMAHSALGTHWQELSDSQRRDFVQLFTAFIEDAYLNRIQGYLDLRFHFVGQTMTGSNRAQVKTYVVETNGDRTDVAFDLEQQGAEWKIYDVDIGSISMINNYRNQFDHVIRGQGFDALMRVMQQKQKELADLLGHPQ
jgi:phospholipid transport system substrate-binding protein